MKHIGRKIMVQTSSVKVCDFFNLLINFLIQDILCSISRYTKEVLFNVISIQFLFPRAWVLTFWYQNKLLTVFCCSSSKRHNKGPTEIILSAFSIIRSLFVWRFWLWSSWKRFPYEKQRVLPTSYISIIFKTSAWLHLIWYALCFKWYSRPNPIFALKFYFNR